MMVPDLDGLICEERSKEMHLTTQKERRKRGDLISINKLMNNLEEIDRKNLILIEKERLEINGDTRKFTKRNLLGRYKKVVFPKEL